eukprot:241374-Amphidinium_carterae.2
MHRWRTSRRSKRNVHVQQQAILRTWRTVDLPRHSKAFSTRVLFAALPGGTSWCHAPGPGSFSA